MKEQVARDWIAALRGGKYKQATNKLKAISGEMCCLGVLCEISGVGTWEQDYMGVLYIAGDSCSTTVLPNAVRDWAGLDTPDGSIDDATTLASLNDNGSSFAELADIIEANQAVL